MSALYQPFPMLSGRRAQAWRHQPSFRRPRHFHAEPELNIVVGGRGVIGLGQERLALKTGDAVFFQPGQDHELLEEDPHFDLFVVALTPELAERAGAQSQRRIGISELSLKDTAELVAFFTGLSKIADAHVTETRIAERFEALVTRFAQPDALCRRALDSVQQDRGVSEVVLAERLLTHPSGISRRVRAALGVTWVTYRTRLRLMDFIRGVDEGSSMLSAALGAGFGSYSQCHRVFQQALGCSPRDYFGGTRTQLDAVVHL